MDVRGVRCVYWIDIRAVLMPDWSDFSSAKNHVRDGRRRTLVRRFRKSSSQIQNADVGNLDCGILNSNFVGSFRCGSAGQHDQHWNCE